MSETNEIVGQLAPADCLGAIQDPRGHGKMDQRTTRGYGSGHLWHSNCLAFLWEDEDGVALR